MYMRFFLQLCFNKLSWCHQIVLRRRHRPWWLFVIIVCAYTKRGRENKERTTLTIYLHSLPELVIKMPCQRYIAVSNRRDSAIKNTVTSFWQNAWSVYSRYKLIEKQPHICRQSSSFKKHTVNLSLKHF